MYKVFIDPGHGGTDPGAIGFGLREKDITLKIALELYRQLFRRVPCRVKLSRNTDRTVSLNDRTHMANSWGADLLLSIHVNAGGGSGFESFIFNGSHPKKKRTHDLQNTLHQAVLKKSGLRDRGKKQANFHMLREATMSAVLTESGFIDHLNDVSKLKHAAFIRRLATGHADGIANMIAQLETKNNLTPNRTYRIKKGDTLWSIARRYNIPLASLLKLNQDIDPYHLQIGQRINLQSSEQVDDRHHMIQRGDTLWALAKTYDSSIDKLKQMNPTVDLQHLQIGQRIRIR
ncbi:N-acetylmuramoyl-L-alanine amidase [Lentibacillus saliphilus]|uniref:N-acetylmuramoyl-L-alanine amidase n=1 Tax=Lentibacillus saliphilus TaxID=2737028 RepID=UPI001C2FB714|nr:N-acetylmuramoyl-L-alanine amidase [Lentibacillus saliphilus]